MAQLTVRNVEDHVVKALKQRAAAHGRSAEAEHRAILREALAESVTMESFAERARRLRERLKSGLDSTDLIRAARDRDHLSGDAG
jgi:plasmid stability protein